MDLSSPTLSYGPHYAWSCPSSDSEFYNVSSPESLSPPSSYMDYSPCSQAQHGSAKAHSCSAKPGPTAPSVSPASSEESGRSRGRPGRNRTKTRSKQRQSASEKEKLRMRDLTKALHHLRSYLPPSVAPAGQTLTKIETLRRTINYISYLSAQLGLSDEALARAKELRSPQESPSGIYPYGTTQGLWGVAGETGPQGGACQGGFGPANPLRRMGMEHHQLSTNMEVAVFEDPFSSSMDSLLESPLYAEVAPSCQNYSTAVHYQSVTPEFWI